jgi:hypothetical protein
MRKPRTPSPHKRDTSRAPRLRLLLLAVLAAWLATGAAAASATASTLQLTVGGEPVESITTQLGGTGDASESENRLYVKVQPAGGEACAANPSADQGEEVISQYLENVGPYSQSVNWTPRTAGSYVMCGWLVHAPEGAATIAAEDSIPVTARIPRLSLSIAVPATVQIGQTFQVATTAQAETSREAFEYILPFTGGACPANAAAADMASGSTGVFYAWNVVGGPLTQTQNESLSTPGVYLVCAYFEYPQSESPPEATANAKTTVVSPPSPCVVPQLTGYVALATVEQRLTAAGCTVGPVRYTASVSVPRGDVVSLSSQPGTKLPAGSAIGVVVSAGRPCVVPVVHAGSSLGGAERKIIAAGCTVGKVSRAHSRRVRHGRVLSISPRPRARLSPRAKVNIRVSAGF